MQIKKLLVLLFFASAAIVPCSGWWFFADRNAIPSLINGSPIQGLSKAGTCALALGSVSTAFGGVPIAALTDGTWMMRRAFAEHPKIFGAACAAAAVGSAGLLWLGIRDIKYWQSIPEIYRGINVSLIRNSSLSSAGAVASGGTLGLVGALTLGGLGLRDWLWQKSVQSPWLIKPLTLLPGGRSCLADTQYDFSKDAALQGVGGWALSDDQHPLVIAARDGNLLAVKRLSEDMPNSEFGHFIDKAFRVAIDNGHCVIVDFLLEKRRGYVFSEIIEKLQSAYFGGIYSELERQAIEGNGAARCVFVLYKRDFNASSSDAEIRLSYLWQTSHPAHVEKIWQDSRLLEMTLIDTIFCQRHESGLRDLHQAAIEREGLVAFVKALESVCFVAPGTFSDKDLTSFGAIKECVTHALLEMPINDITLTKEDQTKRLLFAKYAVRSFSAWGWLDEKISDLTYDLLCALLPYSEEDVLKIIAEKIGAWNVYVSLCPRSIIGNVKAYQQGYCPSKPADAGVMRAMAQCDEYQEKLVKKVFARWYIDDCKKTNKNAGFMTHAFIYELAELPLPQA